MRNNYSYRLSGGAFTLVEILVAVGIAAIVLGIGIPALYTAKANAKAAGIKGNLKTLNEAAGRARLESRAGAGTAGSDEVAAIAWYKTNGYIGAEKQIDLSNINFALGTWYEDPYGSLAEFLADLTTGNPPTWNVAKLSDPAKFAALMGRFSTLSDDLILKAATALSDPSQVASVASAINALAGSPGTHDPTIINSAGLALFNAATSAGGQYAANGLPLDFSNLSLTGVALSSRNLSLTNLTGQQLSQATSIVSSNLAGINMTGFSGTGKTLYGTDFSKASNFTGAMLNGALNVQYANLSHVDMSGYVPNGIQFTGANLSYTNITGTQMWSGLSGFAGADLTGVDFHDDGGPVGSNRLSVGAWAGGGTTYDNSVIPPQFWITKNIYNGFNGDSYRGLNVTGATFAKFSNNTTAYGSKPLDVRNTNITSAQLNAINVPNVVINVDAANVPGWNPSGKNLQGSNIYRADGTTITSPAEFVTVSGTTPSAGTRWIDGTYPWGP